MVRSKNKTYKIPFERHPGQGASMMEYVECDEGEVKEFGQFCGYYIPDEWRDNVPFEATVVLAGHGRGCSSVRVYVLDPERNEKYSMGIGAFYEACRKFGVGVEKNAATITGRWEFRKQGQNYTLWPIGDEDE